MTIYFASNSAMAFDHLEGPILNHTVSGYDPDFTESAFDSSAFLLEIPIPAALPDVWLRAAMEIDLHQNTGNTIAAFNSSANREELYWRRIQNNGDMSLHMWNGSGYTQLAVVPASSEPEELRYFDFHWTIHATQGVFELYMDDCIFMRAENLDTSNLSIDVIRIMAYVSSPVTVGQVIVADEPTICWKLNNRHISTSVERVGYIGSAMQAIAGATSGNTDLSLTALTGGIRAAAQENDYVVAVYATGSTADRTLSITDPGGTPYTLLGTEMYSNDNFDTNLRVAVKKMGSTPDAFVRFGPTGAAADAGVIAAIVVNGVDFSTILDIAASQGTITNSSQFDPASITIATVLARVIMIGACAHDGTVNNFNNVQNFPVWVQLGSSGTNSVRLVIGMSDELSAGAINYSQITTNVNVNTSSSAHMLVCPRPIRVAQTFGDVTNDTANIQSTSGKPIFNVAGSNAADQIIRGRGPARVLPSPSYQVKGVSLASRVRKGETGPQNFNPLVRSNQTDYHQADRSVSVAIDPVNAIWETNPATSAPWTFEQARAALVGIRSRT